MKFDSQREDLKKKGYCIVPINPCVSLLNDMRTHVFKINNCISKKKGLGNVKNEKDLIRFRLENQPLQYTGGKHLWNASTLLSIGGHTYFEYLLKNICNFEEPIHDTKPLIRVDMPIEEQSLFKPHQDYTYNIGSKNAVTFWIPLQDTGYKEGSLLVSPGSHLKGIYENKKGIIDDKFKFEFENCNVKFGEAIIFNQKLVHQSGLNVSNKIRFSIQLRFSDLGCEEYSSRDFPLNSQLKTIRYENET